MIVLLELNGILLNQNDDEIVKLGLGVASSELDYDAIFRIQLESLKLFL
ncbi:TPA: hypothetical protein ACGOWZ_000114 [Streptococcus suis]